MRDPEAALQDKHTAVRQHLLEDLNRQGRRGGGAGQARCYLLLGQSCRQGSFASESFAPTPTLISGWPLGFPGRRIIGQRTWADGSGGGAPMTVRSGPPQPGRNASEQSLCVWLPWMSRCPGGTLLERRGVHFQALLPRPPGHLRGRAADKGFRTLMGRMAAEGAGHGPAFCTSISCVQPWGRGSQAATRCHTRGSWGESV